MIEQKKKLNLEDIQVNSFVTNMNSIPNEQTNDIKAGGSVVINCDQTYIFCTWVCSWPEKCKA